MVVIHTAGVISRDGGGGVKRQVPVQQAAGDTPKKIRLTLKCLRQISVANDSVFHVWL